MNLNSFEKHIKTVSQKTLNEYHDEFMVKMVKTLSEVCKQGYAIALDMLVIESEMRKPISSELDRLSDNELLKELKS